MHGDFLPFWQAHGIDSGVEGGFLCALADDGTLVDSGKFTWYQARGVWTWSHLALHELSVGSFGVVTGAEGVNGASDAAAVEVATRHLRVATGANDFVFAHCCEAGGEGGGDEEEKEDDDEVGGEPAAKAVAAEEEGRLPGWTHEWLLEVSRQGARLAGRSRRDLVGYTGLFVAEGLVELHRARAATVAAAAASQPPPPPPPPAPRRSTPPPASSSASSSAPSSSASSSSS